MKKLLILLLLPYFSEASIYYVSPTGADTNPGTILQPFKTVEKLSTISLAGGDIVYLRGGTYTNSNNADDIHFLISGINGSVGNYVYIWNYPGESPVFNMSNITPTNANPRGMELSNSSYVHLKGITIKNLKQINSGAGVSIGFFFNAPNSIVENFDVYNIGGTAIAFGDEADNTLLLNSDAHHSGDGRSPDQWNFGDAITSTDNLPTGMVLRGCRAYMCGDDGFDFFMWRGDIVTIDNCWSFWNGVKPWGTTGDQPSDAAMTPSNNSFFYVGSPYFTYSGVGYGFKLGGCNTGCVGPAPTTTKKFLTNCIAFENSGEGLGANMLAASSHRMSLFNCVAYRNGNDGFGFGTGRSTGIAQIFKNCWAFGNNVLTSGGDWVYDGLSTNISNNVWMSTYGGIDYGNLNPPVTVTNADFNSVSSDQMVGARQSSGGLPVVTFLTLVSGSDLRNAGTPVGITYCDSNPDVNWQEYCSAGGAPPTANAGTDKLITLPVSSVAMTGAGTGTSITYAWVQLSGPNTGVFSSTTVATPTFSGLIQGVYSLKLTVTDGSSNVARDTVQVTVNPTGAPTYVPTGVIIRSVVHNKTTNKADLSFTATVTANSTSFQVQRRTHCAANYATVETVPVVPGKTDYSKSYTIGNGYTVYRILPIDKQGSPAYSRIEEVKKN